MKLYGIPSSIAPFLPVISTILFVAMLCCAGCTSETEPGPEPTPPHAVELTGVTWHLVSYVNETGTGIPVIEGTDITAYFDENGEVNGTAGCNHYFGGYEVAGDAITFSQIAMTEMYCLDPPGVMRQETEYFAALEDVATFHISADQLTLKDTDGEMVLAFIVVDEKT